MFFLPVIPIILPSDFTTGFTGGFAGVIPLFSVLAKESMRDIIGINATLWFFYIANNITKLTDTRASFVIEISTGILQFLVPVTIIPLKILSFLLIICARQTFQYLNPNSSGRDLHHCSSLYGDLVWLLACCFLTAWRHHPLPFDMESLEECRMFSVKHWKPFPLDNVSL